MHSDILQLGDKIAALTPDEARELCEYLKGNGSDDDAAGALVPVPVGPPADSAGAALDPLDDDRDKDSPFEYSEGYDWSKHDFDSDPDWR
jgi:hypothetical protein